MSGFPGRVNPTPSQITSRSNSGFPRALVIVAGVLLALAVVASLFVFVGLPAIGCPKAGSAARTGSVSDFCFTPFSGHGIGGIVAGPDGNLWFTEAGHIGRITPQGAIAEFALPAGDSVPGAIVAGPDGNLWFVEQAAKALGRITPQGTVTSFPLPAGATSPVGLAAGPDGALWYTRSPKAGAPDGGPPDTATPGLVGRMTVIGTVTEFTLPTPPTPRPAAQPRDIVAGPGGALWFDTGMVNGVASGNSWIGRITTSGQSSMVYAPDPQALVSITAIAAGPDHNLWFTQTSNNINTVAPGAGGPGPGGSGPGGPGQETGSIGYVTPSGAAKLFPLPSSLGAAPGSIIAGPDGNLWFAAASGKIARITPNGQATYFPLPDAHAEIGPLAEGPGAAVWFTQSYPDIDPLNGLIWGTKIGRIAT